MAKSKPQKNGRVVVPAWLKGARSLAEVWLSDDADGLWKPAAGGWIKKPISPAHRACRAKAICCASKLLRFLKLFDLANKAGDIPRALYAVFEIGKCEAEIQRAVFEHGESLTVRAAHKGGLIRDKADPSWQKQVETMMNGSRRTWTDVCEEIGGRSGVTGKTVRKHTTNPRRK